MTTRFDLPLHKSHSYWPATVHHWRKNNTVEIPEDADCFIIVQKLSLSNFFSSLSCPDCFKKTAHFDLYTNKFFGFSANGTLCCVECSSILHDWFLSNRFGGEEHSWNPFEVNILAISSFRGVSYGYSAMKEWCRMCCTIVEKIDWNLDA